MNRRLAAADEVDLESAGRRDYWLRLEHDSIWGEHLIPLSVWVGPHARPGLGLVAFGGTHGNECEGPVAIRGLLGEIDERAVLGRLVLVPVLNPVAFHRGTRDSDAADGVNLNRAFVDGAGSAAALAGITHRIAAAVRQCIWPHVHVVLDLHAGGEVARFARCASYHRVADPQLSAATEATARGFGTPLVLVYQNRTPGLLTSESERLGKITVGTELGWGGAVSVEGVRLGRRGVLQAAVQHCQLHASAGPEGPATAEPQVTVETIDPACYVPAPFPGLYEPVVECGVLVSPGCTIGRLHDFYRIDDPPVDICAQVSGRVVAQAWNAHVIQGQHVAVVGKVVG